MPSTQARRNARNAVAALRSSKGGKKGKASTGGIVGRRNMSSGAAKPGLGDIENGTRGAGPKLRAKFASQIAASGRREARRKGGARVNVPANPGGSVRT